MLKKLCLLSFALLLAGCGNNDLVNFAFDRGTNPSYVHGYMPGLSAGVCSKPIRLADYKVAQGFVFEPHMNRCPAK